MCSSDLPNDLGWSVITPNRLKIGRNNFRQLDGPILLDNCPQRALERQSALYARWYDIIFLERIHLLVPRPERKDTRPVQVGDIVLYVHKDTQFKRLWEWKIGEVVKILSRSTVEIKFVNVTKGRPSFVERSMKQISVILPVNQLPISHPEFFTQNL